jgi:hypothetical protein
MKTTIEIEDALLRRAKQAALERGVTLRQIVEQALLMALGKTSPGNPPLRTRVWPSSDQAGRTISSERILREIRKERLREESGVDGGRRDPPQGEGAAGRRGNQR